jgi:uncharacterized DUF497 family protein
VNVTWDPKKAASNFNKHGIHFSDAEGVLFDPNALTREDEYIYSEWRYVSIGLDFLGRILVVVYAFREEDIRLISARHATRKERKDYEAGI